MGILDQATRKVADSLLKAAGVKIPYTVGTMVELPRAVLLADEIAEVAEFFSFVPRLTHVRSVSRDDARDAILPTYVDETEEFGDFGDFVGEQNGSRQLHHRANRVRNLHTGGLQQAICNFARGLIEDSHLFLVESERNHDLGYYL